MDPFEALASFQQALDAYRTSSWLDPGLSGGGAYPPLNVFRKGDDFIVIAELPRGGAEGIQTAMLLSMPSSMRWCSGAIRRRVLAASGRIWKRAPVRVCIRPVHAE